MTPQNPKQSQPGKETSRPQGEPQRGRKDGPRFDDRPDAVQKPDGDEQPTGLKSRSPQQQRSEERTGLPNYGDNESGDPRRLDVEAGRSGREQTEG
jgi:hypothetical protein